VVGVEQQVGMNAAGCDEVYEGGGVGLK
jgi:hypothetical protein